MNFDFVPATYRLIIANTFAYAQRKHQSMLEEITCEGRHSILGTCRVRDGGLDCACVCKV
jgi:hypothetical protein